MQTHLSPYRQESKPEEKKEKRDVVTIPEELFEKLMADDREYSKKSHEKSTATPKQHETKPVAGHTPPTHPSSPDTQPESDPKLALH